jgi:2-C-methyl-D-erythritol 4-phosphate cytidylyltransferase
MDDPASKVGAILVAAGRGSRFGAEQNKVFRILQGRPIWFHAASRLRQHPQIGSLVIVIAEDDQPLWEEKSTASLLASLGASTTLGGRERTDSVKAGFDKLRQADCDWVAIHDAARPCISQQDLTAVFNAARESQAAILARPLTGSIKRGARDGHIVGSVNRQHLWEALTPQVFGWHVLQTAFARWQGRPVTDDAQLVELAGFQVRLVPGEASNLKVTLPSDLRLAEALLQVI